MTRLLPLLAFAGLSASAHAQASSTTVQTGTGHDAVVTQTVTGPGTLTSSVTQSGAQNEADVNQFGASNAATVLQAGSGNDALIAQGRIAQSPSTGTSTNNTASVTQSGSDNGGFDPTATTNQGDGGVVYQGLLGGTATQNGATVVQHGSSGKAVVVQGFEAGSRAEGSLGSITQAAGTFDNSALIDQGLYGGRSVSDEARINQSGGDRNVAGVYQAYGAGAETLDARAEIDQVGLENCAYVFQGYGGADATAVFADVDQTGTRHYATVLQSGTGHLADVDQTGSFNTASVVQH